MNDKVKIALAALVLAILVIGFSYRSTDRILVKDRYWVYNLHVMYQVCRFVSESKPIRECHRYNGFERCTTTYRTESRQECTSHTRCSSYTSDRELPIARPLPGCQMQPGDYILENIHYIVVAVLDDGDTVTRDFKPEMWEKLEPGAYREVHRNILGNLTDMVEE